MRGLGLGGLDDVKSKVDYRTGSIVGIPVRVEEGVGSLIFLDFQA